MQLEVFQPKELKNNDHAPVRLAIRKRYISSLEPLLRIDRLLAEAQDSHPLLTMMLMTILFFRRRVKIL
jgi:hypothetical protein